MPFPHTSFLLNFITHSARSPLFPYTTLFRSVSLDATGSILPKPTAVTEPAATPCWTRNSWSSRELPRAQRSEEHTSELQSLTNLVCRLPLEKNNIKKMKHTFRR